MPRKPTEAGPGIHTTLRVPREMHEELVRSAGETSVGEEIRKRLAALSVLSGAGAEIDPRDRELLGELVEVIARTVWGLGEIQRPTGGFFFDALERASKAVMARYRPAGDEAVPTDWGDVTGIGVGDVQAAANYALALGMEGRRRASGGGSRR